MICQPAVWTVVMSQTSSSPPPPPDLGTSRSGPRKALGPGLQVSELDPPRSGPILGGLLPAAGEEPSSESIRAYGVMRQRLQE